MWQRPPPPAPSAVLPSSGLSNSTKVELTQLAALAATVPASLMVFVVEDVWHSGFGRVYGRLVQLACREPQKCALQNRKKQLSH